ncbi:MAG: protein translocase SEC61 complex subunit gamma [Candidatus Aenigmatarchaeota archaeon]
MRYRNQQCLNNLPAPQPAPVQPKEEKKPEAPKGPTIFEKLKMKLLGYRRVLEVSHKPDAWELISTAKVVLLGITLMGAIGFIISMIYILAVQAAGAGV